VKNKTRNERIEENKNKKLSVEEKEENERENRKKNELLGVLTGLKSIRGK
jgi:hypothetical protein